MGCRPKQAGHGWRVEIDELPVLHVYAIRSRRPCEIDITVDHHPGVMGVTYSSDIQNKAVQGIRIHFLFPHRHKSHAVLQRGAQAQHEDIDSELACLRDSGHWR